MIDAYREAAVRGDKFGKVVFGVLLIVRVVVKATVWSFIAGGLSVVVMICKGKSQASADSDIWSRGFRALLRLYKILCDALQQPGSSSPAPTP